MRKRFQIIWSSIENDDMKVLWEGTGKDNPWGVFELLGDIYKHDIVSLYLVNVFSAKELAQRYKGKLYFEGESI